MKWEDQSVITEWFEGDHSFMLGEGGREGVSIEKSCVVRVILHTIRMILFYVTVEFEAIAASRYCKF